MTDGDHPYMKHWWVPGLQIGYEHTFVHQLADFLDGVAAGLLLAKRQEVDALDAESRALAARMRDAERAGDKDQAQRLQAGRRRHRQGDPEQVGMQIRHDRLSPVGLYGAVGGARVAVTQESQVRQTLAGVYAENKIRSDVAATIDDSGDDASRARSQPGRCAEPAGLFAIRQPGRSRPASGSRRPWRPTSRRRPGRSRR